MSFLFEQQITEYLKPYSPNEGVLKTMSALVAERMTEEPCMPIPSIAGPVLIHCIWADEETCSGYACLLAASMSPEKRGLVHPAFASIVGQLDSLDLAFLHTLCERVTMGVANCYLCKTKKEGGFASRQVEIKSSAVKVISRMTEFLPEDGDYARVQATIDNLIRLQLIEIHMRSEREELAQIQSDVYENIYMLFEQVINKTVDEFRERFPKYHGGQIRLSTGNIMLTTLGTRFIRVCLP